MTRIHPIDPIVVLNTQLQQALARTAQLRQAGSQEQYLESYFLAEALELQLGRLLNDRAHAAADARA